MYYQLQKPVTRIGRSPDNDVVIANDKRVSKYHAEIRREDGSYVVVDLQSTNGTMVNGQRTNRHRLADGDLIRIGDSTITYQRSGLTLGPNMTVSTGQRTVYDERRYADLRRSQPASPASWLLVGLAGLALVALVVAVVALNRMPQETASEAMARKWVADNTFPITGAITNEVARWINLEPDALRNKVQESVVNPTSWTYSPPVKVAEGVYEVEAVVSFPIVLTTPPRTFNVRASYLVTVDPVRKEVTRGALEDVQVAEVR